MKFSYWNKSGFLCLEVDYEKPYGDILASAGYFIETMYGSEDDSRLSMFKNEDNGFYIIQLYSYSHIIFSFLCVNEKDAYMCFSHMASTAKNMQGLYE